MEEQATASVAAATATSKAAATAAMIALKKSRQLRNQEAVKYFGIGIVSLIFLVSSIFWSRTLYRRRRRPTNSMALEKLSKVSRTSRKILLRKVPGFASAGHAFIYALYLLISFSVLFTNINWTHLTDLSKRLGWLTVLNLTVTIFLSLKNTPLAILTNQSHEKLNSLHQIAGYSCVASYLLHAALYITNLFYLKKIDVLWKKTTILGIISGLSLLIIFFTALFLRKRQYELFYVTHVFMALLAIVTAILHRPEIAKTRSSEILIFALTIWSLDRLVRIAKLCILNTTATITPLLHGGVRIVLSRAPKSAVPGNHFFIWLPAIRTFETHPFTCISTAPMEMIVSAQNGFTRELLDRAMMEPGAVLRASVHGPYGTVNDLTVFHRVVFIAGGSGASYTCALATDLLRKIGPSSNVTIDFTLVLKEKEMIEWTSTLLNLLAESPLVNLHIYITSSKADDVVLYTPGSFHFGFFSTFEKHPNFAESQKSFSISPHACDIEKPISLAMESPINKPIVLFPGRPDINSIILENVETTLPDQRIAVAACGPDKMMLDLRKAVTENIRIQGPSIEIFCEHFSW